MRLGMCMIVGKVQTRCSDYKHLSAMNTPYVLRPAVASDFDALLALSRITFVETFAEFNSAEDNAAYLAHNLGEERFQAEVRHPKSQFYVAERGETLVGYLKLNHGDAQTEPKGPEALEIERIYVLKSEFGTGAGRQLLDTAFLVFQAGPYKVLWLGVWEKNERAIAFYQKNGFKIIGEHIFQLGSDAQTDYVMEWDGA